MRASPFDNSNLATVVAPNISRSVEMSTLTATWQQYSQRLEYSTNAGIEWQDETFVDGRAFKGVCWALAIEASAAICVYFLWHLWNVVR